MRVEADLFSGCPNPSWDLTAKEAEEVGRLLASLPSLPGPAPAAGDELGFRGFVLTGDMPGAPGPVRQVFVRETSVSAVGVNGLTQCWVDSEKRLAQWLTEAAKSHLDADLWTVLNQALHPRAD